MKTIALTLAAAGFVVGSAFAQDDTTPVEPPKSSDFNFAAPADSDAPAEAGSSFGGFNFKLPGDEDAAPMGLGSAPLPDEGAAPLPGLSGDAPIIETSAN